MTNAGTVDASLLGCWLQQRGHKELPFGYVTVQLPEGWIVKAVAGEGEPNPGIGMCKGTEVREYGELKDETFWQAAAQRA